MKKLLVVLLFVNSFLISIAQSTAEKRNHLEFWIPKPNPGTKGILKNSMKGCWNSDSLMFMGKSGVTYGYENTLNNYKKSYPDTSAMGKLSYNILQVKKLSPEYYFVVGKWLLTRTAGNLQGHYSLIFRKIKGSWVIVSDHSS